MARQTDEQIRQNYAEKYGAPRDAEGRHTGSRPTGAEAQPYATMAAVAKDVVDGKSPTEVAQDGVDVPATNISVA